MKCEKCRRFEVHMHEERLGQPAATKKPGVVLVDFTCDVADWARLLPGVVAVQRAAQAAPWHTYVWLTREPSRFLAGWEHLEGDPILPLPPNWYLGTTIRYEHDAERVLPQFLAIQGNLWLSLEPLESPVDFHGRLVRSSDEGTSSPALIGVIIGHDNRRCGLGTHTLDYIRSAVRQCQEAGMRVYVKQLYIRSRLEHDPATFPPDLRLRQLPWETP
jgi:protein gp37